MRLISQLKFDEKLLIYMLSVFLLGCSPEGKTPKAIEISDRLKGDFEVGEIYPVRNVIKREDGILCMLSPYQEMIANHEQDESINKFIVKSGYKGREGYWALLVYSKEEGEIISFKRSSELDNSGGLPIVRKPKRDSDVTFMENDCVNIKNGVFFKELNENRVSIMIGEIK